MGPLDVDYLCCQSEDLEAGSRRGRNRRTQTVSLADGSVPRQVSRGPFRTAPAQRRRIGSQPTGGRLHAPDVAGRADRDRVPPRVEAGADRLAYSRAVSIRVRWTAHSGRRRHRTAASATSRDSNTPKTADPLPDIDAQRAPARRSAAVSRRITGCRRATGRCRSFRPYGSGLPSRRTRRGSTRTARTARAARSSSSQA